MTALLDRTTASPAGKAVKAAMDRPGTPARAVRMAVASAVVLLVVNQFFHPTLFLYVKGIANGSLYGLTAVGIILIYRTNRIINFAAADMGGVPALLAIFLLVRRNVPWEICLPVAIIGGVLLGAAIDKALIRWFATAPRLILTIATVGLANFLTFGSLELAVFIRGKQGNQRSDVPTPFKNLVLHNHRGLPVLNGDQVFALVVVLAMAAGLAVFLRKTRMGIALRASAENADRALLLGIPVRRVSTVAWAIAGLFSSVALFLRAPLSGVPIDGRIGPSVLLFTLAAAVIAKLDDIPLALLSSMFIGILEQGSVLKTGSNAQSSGLMLVILLVALLVRRKAQARALDTGTSTWQAVKEFRAIPTELRDLPEVRTAKAIGAVALAVFAIGLPYVVKPGDLSFWTTFVVIEGMVAVSLVILTGWAGQVSLGQFGLVGVGAAVGGGLAANHNVDFFFALFAGVAAGALVSVLIGLPAVRVQGIYLAVTTLALGATMEDYLLNKRFSPFKTSILPHGSVGNIPRPALWGRIDLTNNRSFYYLCLVFLGLTVAAARAFRRNRSGRVLIAVRDNQRGAPAYAINVVRTRLAAFAVSGGIASLAGVLLAYQQRALDGGAYGLLPSLEVFLVTVIGGVASIPGALLGVFGFGVTNIYVPHLKWLPFHNDAALLFTGPLLLLTLVTNPAGTAEGLYRARDQWLRRLSVKHDIVVPSLVADRRVEQVAQDSAVTEAEHQAEELDVRGHRTITCPVCGEAMGLEAAADHEHLRPDVAAPVGAAR